MIILNIPFALIGGIIALVVGEFNLSVSASVGFIALFGVAVLNGVVMVSYFNELRREGMKVADAVIEGAVLRLRPVLITASVAALGLMPVGAAFYAWDIGVKRGNIQVLGAASYAAPLLSTLVLIAFGFAEPSWRIFAACVLITGGAVLAARSLLFGRRSAMERGASA